MIAALLACSRGALIERGCSDNRLRSFAVLPRPDDRSLFLTNDMVRIWTKQACSCAAYAQLITMTTGAGFSRLMHNCSRVPLALLAASLAQRSETLKGYAKRL